MSANIHYDLAMFIGSEKRYSHGPLFRGVEYSEGVKYLAERGSCWWLVDMIASHLLYNEEWVKHTKADDDLKDFSVWTLTPDGEGGAVLEARKDTSTPVLASQRLTYTDFPFDGGEPFKLYVGGGSIIFLPSEY